MFSDSSLGRPVDKSTLRLVYPFMARLGWLFVTVKLKADIMYGLTALIIDMKLLKALQVSQVHLVLKITNNQVYQLLTEQNVAVQW